MGDKKTGIAPKIDIGAVEFYQNHFRTLNAGATWALETFPHLYRDALSDMRGVFSLGELSMVLEVLNGSAILELGSVGLSGRSIGIEIEDSFRLYPGQYEAKWGVDPADLLPKINGLSRFNRVALEIWAAGFWRQQGETPESWAAPLLEPWGGGENGDA